ncbi:recombinase family protein [Pseudoflavonifractor phocaeensis]|uniref:recombinase family protein n=1 Tax=Pseudoflavonifractor phocaeensis TaxID=1870988 RepID=UPI00195772E2|nr:recombinase family protein [Pseudoflavonifractor phocaeensis]MBM6886987.1 recombinase family protein [Pseudoflavonifractor phocaeensis]
MRTDKLTLGFAYLRLSNEEAQEGESSSITNQRMIVQNYCKQNGITLVREFVDDGYSGGNFDRPAFQEMMRQLSQGKANTVITKDLSRLGRDMRESSYYAEQFFPEHGIHYIAISDNFDTEHENIMAPFLFAMNEVYLRDGSRKVKDVLRNKRENGQYCACPPYGYRKDTEDKHRLAPDERTAPVVQRIFQQASNGDSSRKIALDLNADGVIPPLKYRVLYRDQFSEEGAARASDLWNYTTVKRILKNQVYLGHTLLGKSKKASVKSKKKVPVPKEDWAITENTHPPLISESLYHLAQVNLGRGSRNYRAYDQVRKSIFSGIAICAKCGHSLCSCGTVYKGEREKYWYLSCTHQRQDIADPCTGVRIRYADLLEVVRRDLNAVLAMTPAETEQLFQEALRRFGGEEAGKARRLQKEQAEARLLTIDKVVAKLYTDNAEGRLDDERLCRLVEDLERESAGLRGLLETLKAPDAAQEAEKNYARFFALVRQYTRIESLDREILQTFVERIEVGPKEYSSGTQKATHRNQPYRQSIRIFYRFIGELDQEAVRAFPQAVNE